MGLAFSTVSYFTEHFKFNPLEVVSCADGMQLNQIGLIPPTIISPKGKFWNYLSGWEFVGVLWHSDCNEIILPAKINDMLKKRPLTVNHTYDCLFKNRTRGLAEMDYDGSVVPIGKLMKYSTRKIINFLKLSFVLLKFLLRFFSSYFEFSIN